MKKVTEITIDITIIIVILGSLTGGYLIDKYGSEFDLKEKKVSYINDSNQIVNKSVTFISKKIPLLETLSKFLYSLAISLFIGLFITSRIESKRKKEHENELKTIQANINMDVFDGLFRKLVPDEIFAVIKRDIISTPVIRKDALWLLEFYKKDGNNKVYLRTDIEFTLINLSNNVIDYPVLSICESLSEDEDKLIKVSAKRNNNIDVLYELNQKNDKCKYEEKNGEKILTVNYSVYPKDKVVMNIVWDTKYISEEIKDAFFSQTALVNAKLEIRHPEEYEFKLFSSMSSPFVLQKSEKDRRTYVAEGGILPMQGLVYNLSKKNQNSVSGL